MHKVSIGIAVALIVLVVGVAYAIANVNGILEKNRPRLASIASDAVGRQVDFDRAEVAFSRGLAVRVTGLRVAEDRRFGKPDFLLLDSAFVGVKLWPALFGRIEIRGVRLEAPVIRIILTADGFNFSTIGQATRGDESAASEVPDDAMTAEGEALALVIANFEIEGGVVMFEDRTSSPPLALTFEELKISGTDLSLDGPLALSFSGRLRGTGVPTDGSAPSTRFEGDLALDSLVTAQGRFRIQSPAFYPSLVGANLDEDPKADHLDGVTIEVELPADPEREGHPISLTVVSGRLAGFDFNDVDIDLLLRGDELDIERVWMRIVEGEVELTGKMKFGAEGEPSPFDLMMELRELDAGELASVLLGLPPGAVSGRIGGDLTLAGESLEWERLERTLIGKIRLEMGEGALENVNLMDSLVGGLVSDPGLGMLMANTIRNAAPDLLDGDRTEIQRIGIGLEVADGRITTDDFEMRAGDFLLSVAGGVALDGALAGNGEILFSEALSRKLVRKADLLEAWMVEGDRIGVPIRIDGTTSAPRLRPDLRALSLKIGRALQNEAVDALGDLIFGKTKKRHHDGPEEGEEAGQSSDRDALEETLKRGLGRLFGN